MNLKKISFILAVLLVACVALGSVAAAEDIADDVTAISDDASIDADVDSIDDVVSVSEDADDAVEVVDEVAPVEEEVADSVDDVVEPSRDITYTNHQVDVNNWTDFDFTQGNVIVDFDSGFYSDFNIASLGDYTTLNGNGATLIGNGNTVINIANTQGVKINGFNIYISDSTQNGIAGNYVYDAEIYNNSIHMGDDAINIYRDWNNISVYNNTISTMNRDGISLANPTHTDLSTLYATIHNNIISDCKYGIFVGGNFNGEIYQNTIYQTAPHYDDILYWGMQFAGKPQASNGTLIADIHDNDISTEIGIDMFHPGVSNLTLTRNNITGTNMSIDTNGSFSKTANGGIYLYNNTLNGIMSDVFIGNITEAFGNDGANAYNNASNDNEDLLFEPIILKSKSILMDVNDNNIFENGDFNNPESTGDTIVGWTLKMAAANIWWMMYPNGQSQVKDPFGNAIRFEYDTENQDGKISLLSGSSATIPYIYWFIQENVNLTDVEYISFDGKFTKEQEYGLMIDSDQFLPLSSNTTKADGEWNTYTIPQSDFASYAADNQLHTVKLVLYMKNYQQEEGTQYQIPAYIDNIIAFKNAAVPTYTADDLQNLINDAAEGGVIDLVAGAIYDVGSTQFTLTKKVTINGNGATIIASGAAQGGQGAVIIAKAAGTTFKDIIFKNSDGHKEYGEGVAGNAIELAIENGTVDNCTFLDWSSGIYGRGAAFCTIMNSYFNGSSDLVTGAGKGEKGTKAINLMGSHDITVKGCTFEGQVLDGISIASNSGHNIMTDNTFIDNVYAIYFGGASTQGCVIANNTFIRCGYCPNVTDEINKKVTILSTQKACNGFIIADNQIEALSGTTFISMESGNTAHGYPSTIGDINVTANTLALAEGAVAQTITFVKILSNQGELSPYAPINISGNDLADGVTPVKVWYADWGSEDNPVIPAADPVVTSIEIVDVSTATKKLTVKLVDIGGEALAGETITYSINGAEAKTAETDEDGLVTIDVTENGVVAIAFEGNDQYKSAETSINFAATAQRTETQIIYQNMTTTAVDTKSDGRIGKYFIITLKDSTGKAIANKPVQIGFNGVVYDRVTDENGQAKLQINLKAEGVYTFAVAFLGDDQYNGSFVVAKITVSKQKGSLTVPAKSYAASAATKTLTATFKSAKGNPVAGKKVTFTVNGKTYSATTNAKGVATVKVSLNKKGTYSFTAKFAGDNTYAAISKSAKLTIK